MLPSLVDSRWKRLRHEVRNGGRHPGDDRLHQVRKRSKQLRYASELAAPLIGKRAKKTAKAAQSLQTLLGEHRDAVVASEWLQQAANQKGVDVASDIATLIDQQDQRRKQLRRRWRSRYRRLTDA